MKGYVTKKGDRWYAVIYEGIDPATGKERRSWHAAGPERGDAERLAARLAAKANGRLDAARALTFGTYLQSRWLPAKKAKLQRSTFAGYRGNVELHIIPTLGKTPFRRLRDKHLESLYDRLRTDRRSAGAVAEDGVGDPPHHPRRSRRRRTRRVRDAQRRPFGERAPASDGAHTRTAVMDREQLQAFLRAAAGHRLFAAFWTLAMTGMRRSELLGLRWSDIDLDKATLLINRGVVAVGYCTNHGARPATRGDASTSTRPPCACSLRGGRGSRPSATPLVPKHSTASSPTRSEPRCTPHSISRAFERIAARADVPVIRLHDLRHTHATLLIKPGCP